MFKTKLLSFLLFFFNNFFFLLLQSEAPGLTPLALAEGWSGTAEREGFRGWLGFPAFPGCRGRGKAGRAAVPELPGKCHGSWLRAFLSRETKLEPSALQRALSRGPAAGEVDVPKSHTAEMLQIQAPRWLDLRFPNTSLLWELWEGHILIAIKA